MKTGWAIRDLGGICAFENGDRGENYPSKSAQTTSGVPFINAGHLTDSGIDFSDMNYIPRERFDLLGNGKIRKGDVLFCLRGSLGKFSSVGDLSEGAIASSLIIIRPSNELSNEFLLAYLQSDLCAEMIHKFKNGAAQPNLSAASLKKFLIPIPPLAEQRRIVGVLGEAFAGLSAARAHAEKNLQNTRALFESQLHSVFTQHGPGWVESKLGDLAEFKNGLNFTRQSKGQRLRIVGVGDFQDNAVVPIEALQSVTINGKLSDDYLIRCNDILAVRSNGSRDLVGRCMLVPEMEEKTSYSGFVIRIRFDAAAISPRFLLRYLKSSGTRAQLTRDGGGANISNINQAKLSELPISLPSFREQEHVADRFDAIATETQRLENLYRQKIAALAALKKSLLHRALNGELLAQ